MRSPASSKFLLLARAAASLAARAAALAFWAAYDALAETRGPDC